MGNKRKAKRGHKILAKPKKKVTQTTGLETEEAFEEKPERNKSGLIWKKHIGTDRHRKDFCQSLRSDRAGLDKMGPDMDVTQKQARQPIPCTV